MFIEKTEIFCKAPRLFFFCCDKVAIYTKIIFILFNKIFMIWMGGMVEKATTSPLFKSVALILDRRNLGTETF